MPEELLIVAKTYPLPSAKYRETTCVAAITRAGELRRLFPVPFRLLEGKRQFKKWEWIEADCWRASTDQRPDSYRIDVDSIVRTGKTITTERVWSERRGWIDPHLVASFSVLEARRRATGKTLGFVRPGRLLGLAIIPAKDAEWTEEEKARLQRDGLFDCEAVKSRPLLRKLPYDFYYRYECETAQGIETWRHMITDWEAGAFYWNCVRSYGTQWEGPLRHKLEEEFGRKDLIFLMGTMHRFPDQWLIVGLVYPPKAPGSRYEQLAFLDLKP